MEWDVVGESASPMLLLLCTSLTAYKVPPFTKWGWVLSCFMQQDSTSMYFILSKCLCSSFKTYFHALDTVWCYCTFL
jgi:hypothetical protein